MVNERSKADLLSILYEVKEAIVQLNWPLTRAEDVELVEADDGTPSLAVPVGSCDILIVTPEPLLPQRYAVVLMGERWRGVIANALRLEAVTQFVLEQIRS